MFEPVAASDNAMFITTNFNVLEKVTRAELSVLKHGVKNGLVPVHVQMGRIPGYTCMFVCCNIHVCSVLLFWGS